MSDEKEADTADPSWALRIAIGGPLIILAVYVVALALEWPMSAERFGQLGDSFAPLAAIFSIVAVAVALRSVELQRRELQLQREELRENREEMRRQREEFERTATAQTRLADAQRDLAEAQKKANILTMRTEHATRTATVASLRTALQASERESAREDRERFDRGGLALAVGANTDNLPRIRDLAEAEEARVRELSGWLGLDVEQPSSSPDEGGGEG
jgi:hypothetical protein